MEIGEICEEKIAVRKRTRKTCSSEKNRSQPKISVEKGMKPDILVCAGAQLRRPRLNGARLNRVESRRTDPVSGEAFPCAQQQSAISHQPASRFGQTSAG